MNGQNQQQATSGESIQAQQFQPGQFHQDHNIRTPYMASQAYHGPAVNTRDANSGNLSQLLGALNLPNQRPGSNYNSVKGSLSQATPSIEIPGFHRTPYNGQYMILPNGTMVGGIPHATTFPQPHLSGHDPLQYTPASVYPAFVAGTSMIPGNIQGYTWPYSVNPDISDFNASRGNSLSSSEDNKAASDLGIPQNCYPTVGAVERAALASYAYNMPTLPQTMQPYLQYQMMKSSNGYVLQDLEALTQQDPPIPRAVPAMWTNPSDLTLAKCLENREGITNVYIRGFLPETTDEMLHAYASRFGKIERCKAIIDLETGLCKGFGFVQFYNFESCENCIRGFFYLGYQASFAQKSRNSRLKDLEDKSSTNIYCTNVPIDWTEADLRRHFEPYRVVSEKINRDEKTGVSKEVGFARFETREIAENVLAEFHNVTGKGGVKLLLRFADTKAQKILKQQSNERRAYRAGEYNYSVEVVQGSTPSPTLHRLQQTSSHISPSSQLSYQSPIGVGPVWTPATSISPSGPLLKNSVNRFGNSWPSRSGLSNLDSTPGLRGRLAAVTSNCSTDNLSAGSAKTTLPISTRVPNKPQTPSPKKENIKAGSLSPIASRKEVDLSSPKSSI
ncbi:hypothetical protein V8E54_002852 [Elaphomyces granulatus]